MPVEVEPGSIVWNVRNELEHIQPETSPELWSIALATVDRLYRIDEKLLDWILVRAMGDVVIFQWPLRHLFFQVTHAGHSRISRFRGVTTLPYEQRFDSPDDAVTALIALLR